MISYLSVPFVQFALVFAVGLLFSKLVEKIHLPSVTGYLIGGLLLGPHILNIITLDTVETLSVFSEIALGFIAFSIGAEFKISYFKKVGVVPVVIACLESLFAVLCVFLVLTLFNFDLSFSLMLSAIAAATAPAATIMVIKQYKAKGPVSETLLSVVAIDDATALIIFGFALAFVNGMSSGSGDIAALLILPFVEILMSVLVGGVIGLILSYVIRFFRSDSIRNPLVLMTVLLVLGSAEFFGASDLMSAMVCGAIFCNLSNQAERVMALTDVMTPALFMMFFVMSGAELDISVLPTVGGVGVIYIVMRVIGKYLGAYAGGKLSGAHPSVQKFLGPCLVPQAGVAIGLSLIAESTVPGHGATIRAVVLCATLVYELIGPFLTKTSLKMAGEIKE